MKYISIDLEFTSLDLDEAQILEFGAIIEDTEKKLPYEECPKFQCYVNHKKITGNVYALAMNADILKILAKVEDIKDKDEKTKYIKDNNILNDYEVSQQFLNFVFKNNLANFGLPILGNGNSYFMTNGDGDMYPVISSKLPKTELVLAGKNLQSKDIPLLKTLPRWNDAFIMSHRTIDPVSYFINWKDDKNLPSLSECKKRANISGSVTHKALDDAWDVIQLIRTQY